MNVTEILIIFVLFCLIWILTNIFWKVIEGKMLIKRQNDLMDAAYSKFIRLFLQFNRDFKGLREVIKRD